MIKDNKTVNINGESIQKLIDGVNLRKLNTIADERGSICEVYDLRWGFHDEPLVYVYSVRIRPRQYKGWVCHKYQDDRLFFELGEIKMVLYDGREDSPTYRRLNEFMLGTNNRALISIPAGVWHLLFNVGTADAIFINMPTKPFNHEDPDKYRLPLNNDIIPYRNKYLNS